MRYLPTLLTLALFAALVLYGPIAQFEDYNEFADQTRLVGIPHAGDVLSNLGFVLVAIWGAWRLRSFFANTSTQRGRYGYRLFLAGLLMTAVGSSYYHLAPDNARLVWDRLPIALSCAGLLAAMRAECGIAASEARDTVLLALGAIAGVLWWRFTDLFGAGDLRWYLLFQVLPLVLVPLWQVIGKAPRTRRLAVVVAVVLYVDAKLFELYDHQLLTLLGVVSGHTLKHIFSAVAAAVILPHLEPLSAKRDLNKNGESLLAGPIERMSQKTMGSSKYLKHLLAFSAAIIVGMAFLPSHASGLPRPPLFILWDIRPENGEIEADFEITKIRNYHIDVDFGHFGGGVSVPIDIIGGTAYEIVTNEPNPKIVSTRTLAEAKIADELVDKGVYKWREKESGKKIKFEVWIEKWTSDRNSKAVIFHDTEDTCCRDFGSDREITRVILKPGLYHIRVKKFDALPLPNGVKPALEVTFYPNETVQENKN